MWKRWVLMLGNEKIQENSRKLLNNLPHLSEGELVELISFHNQKYFIEASPEISDFAFDKLVEALRIINPNAPILEKLESEEPANQLKHKRPMLSLDKCYDESSFYKWAEKITGDLVAMPKIDGVALSIIYSESGELVEAATRGDGRVGENISKNILMIDDVPKKLPIKPQDIDSQENNLEIRGEIYLPLSTFEEKYAQEFSSPRNLAAGALKLKDFSKTKDFGLKFFPYDLRGSTAQNEAEKFSRLEKYGFSMMPFEILENNEKATQAFSRMEEKRKDFDFEIDGVVFRANELSEQVRLGETAHHPRYAIAYKFQGESAQTKLVKVEWSLARSGAITPVAIVEPVFVSNATISRASLHNLGIFLSLDLREQSLVEINRRGGVIPQVERVLMRSGEPIFAPKKCPGCQGDVRIERDFLYCSAKNQCEQVVVAKLCHFARVLDIEGLGEKLVRKLYKNNLLRSYKELYLLESEQIADLDGMGELSANKLIEQIQQKKSLPLAIFLRALGIDDVGANVAELISANFHSFLRIQNLVKQDLVAIHGIGEKIAESLINGLTELKDEIDELLKLVKVQDFYEENQQQEGQVFYQKSFVFTGKMAHMDRKSAQNLVKKLGGKAPGAMNEKVNFLVIGDEGSALLGQGAKSTKQKAAEKMIKNGSLLKIISESEFLKMTES